MHQLTRTALTAMGLVLVACRLDGGEPNPDPSTSFFSPPRPICDAVAVDDRFAYIHDTHGDGKPSPILRISPGLGNLFQILAVAVDADRVYWAEWAGDFVR